MWIHSGLEAKSLQSFSVRRIDCGTPLAFGSHVNIASLPLLGATQRPNLGRILASSSSSSIVVEDLPSPWRPYPGVKLGKRWRRAVVLKRVCSALYCSTPAATGFDGPLVAGASQTFFAVFNAEGKLHLTIWSSPIDEVRAEGED